MFNTSSKIGAQLAQRFAVRNRGRVTVPKTAIIPTYQETRAEAQAMLARAKITVEESLKPKGLAPVTPAVPEFGKRGAASPVQVKRASEWLDAQLIGR